VLPLWLTWARAEGLGYSLLLVPRSVNPRMSQAHLMGIVTPAQAGVQDSVRSITPWMPAFEAVIQSSEEA